MQTNFFKNLYGGGFKTLTLFKRLFLKNPHKISMAFVMNE